MEPGEREAGPEDVAFGVIPELTRGLRALGSTRAGGALQTQFFQPLLDGRRRAADARGADARVRAFEAGDLQRALDRLLERIVAEWPDARNSARRALRAELQERTAGYCEALRRLDARAKALTSALHEAPVPLWRAWTSELVATFAAADRTWSAIRPVLEATEESRRRLTKDR